MSEIWVLKCLQNYKSSNRGVACCSYFQLSTTTSIGPSQVPYTGTNNRSLRKARSLVSSLQVPTGCEQRCCDANYTSCITLFRYCCYDIGCSDTLMISIGTLLISYLYRLFRHFTDIDTGQP